ncbi:pantothenate permease [Spirochaetia bacterium]|nr:pantothenate permease [Spirochaetia bacterium]
MAVVILGFFILIPLVLGLVANRKMLPTTEDFFVQGRSMGSVAVFFTVAATWWSAFAFLGSNGYFYSQGPVYWTALAWNILFGFLYYFIGKKIWYYGKNYNCITAGDFFHNLYGSRALANIVAVVLLVFTVPYLQIQLTGGAYLIQQASGGVIPTWAGSLIFYAVIVIYVWSGGLRAVAWTDIFYGVLLFFGMIFAGFYLASKLAGGYVQLFQTLRNNYPQNLTLPGPSGKFGPMMWVSMFILTPVGNIVGAPHWTKMYAVKSPKFFSLMPFLLSLAAIAYIGSMLAGSTGILAVPQGTLKSADLILPYMLFQYTPFVLAALICACGAAAAMSTACSQIHSMSAIFTVDIYRRYLNPKADNKAMISMGRIAILVFALFAYFMSLFNTGLLVTVGLLATAGTAQILIPTVGILYWKRSTVTGAVAGLLISEALVILFQFKVFTAPLGMHGGLFSLIVNAIVFIIVSLVSKPRDPEIVKKFEEQKAEFNANYS